MCFVFSCFLPLVFVATFYKKRELFSCPYQRLTTRSCLTFALFLCPASCLSIYFACVFLCSWHELVLCHVKAPSLLLLRLSALDWVHVFLLLLLNGLFFYFNWLLLPESIILIFCFPLICNNSCILRDATVSVCFSVYLAYVVNDFCFVLQLVYRRRGGTIFAIIVILYCDCVVGCSSAIVAVVVIVVEFCWTFSLYYSYRDIVSVCVGAIRGM